MKKFMIFLLMAFLYLGTCQARSESAHPNDGKLKLLSWVTPTPSQSFLTRSLADATISIQPSGTVYLGTSGSKLFQANVQNVETTPHYAWKLQKAGTTAANTVGGDAAQCTISNLDAGNYSLYCVLSYAQGDVTVEVQSAPVTIIVAQHEFTVNIIGATEGCENDEVTLTAQIYSEQVAGFKYLWKVNGEAPVGYVTNEQTFKFKPSELFGGPDYDNLTYEFTVEVAYEGCSVEISPVHPFTIIPAPIVTIDGPQYLCTELSYVDNVPTFVPVQTAYTYTATVDGQQPDHYVWFVKYEWENEIYTELITTTNVNTASIPYYNVEQPEAEIGVLATYADNACNSVDTVWTPAPVMIDLQELPTGMPYGILLSYAGQTHVMMGRPEVENEFVVCQGSEMVLNMADFVQYFFNYTQSRIGDMPETHGNLTYRLRDAFNGNVVAEYEIDAEHAYRDGSLAMIHMNANEIGTHVYTLSVQYEAVPCEIYLLEYKVDVVGAPEVRVTGNNVICAGDSANLVANVYYTNTAVGEFAPENLGFKYIWSDNPEDTLDVNTKKIGDAGQYMVVVFDTVSGCTADAQFSVVTFGGNLQMSADNMDVCEGETVVLNAYLEGFNNENVTYTWSNGDNGSTTSVNPTLDKTKFSVVANAGNCSMTDTLEITVHKGHIYNTVIYNSQQNPNITSESSNRLTPAHYCEGQEIATYEVKDRLSEGNAQTLYTWFIDGVEVPGTGRNLIIPSGLGVGSHYIQAKRIVSGCDSALLSKSLNFIIHPAPELQISGNNVICNGDTAFIKVDASTMPYQPNANVPYSYSYKWSDDHASMIDTITEGGIYTVTVTSKIGDKELCTATASVNVITSGADMQIIADKTVICDGEYINLRANFEGFVNENASYVWTDADGTVIGNSSNVTVHPSESTQYVLTINAGEACTMSDTIDITVHQLPGALTVVRSTNPAICAGSQATFQAMPPVDGLSYIWFQNGVQIPGENLSSITVNLNEAGTYKYAVMGVDQYGCPTAVPAESTSEYNTVGTYTITDYNAASLSTALRIALILGGVNPNSLYTQGNTHEISGPVTINLSVLPADSVDVLEAPKVDIFGNNVICNGDVATLTATAIPAEDENHEYTYQWSNAEAPGLAVMETQELGIYTVTVSNVAKDVNCQTVASVNVTVFGGDLHVNADQMEVCQGGMITLTANLDGFENEMVTYAWEGENLVANTGSSVAAAPTTPGVAKYVVTANAGNCSMTDSVLVTVNELPATVLVNRTTDSVICVGTQATFEAVPSSAEMSYIWFENGVRIPGENLNTITVNMNEAGTYKYAVLAYDQNGCPSIPAAEITDGYVTTGTYQYDTTAYNQINAGTGTFNRYFQYILRVLGVNGLYTQGDVNTVEGTTEVVLDLSFLSSDSVVVMAAPQVALTGNNIICNGDTARIMANVLPAEDEYHLYTYQWSNDTTTALMKTLDGGIYTVTVTDTAMGLNCQTVASVNVIASGADLQIIADKTVICDGEYINLRANSDGFENENVSYVWTDAEGNVISNSSNVTVNPSESTQYVLTINAGEACTMSDTIDITVHARPENATLVPSAEYICQGGQVSFTVEPANPAYNYQWFLNGLMLANEGTSTLTLNLNEPGGYEVAARITNEYGCAALNPQYAEPVENSGYYFNGEFPFIHRNEGISPFVVKVLPTPQVELTGNNTICTGDTAVISVNVLPASDDVATLVNQGVDYVIDNYLPQLIEQYASGLPISTDAIIAIVKPIVEGAVSQFVNSILPSDYSYEYQWSSNAPADANDVLRTDLPGIYTVTVTNTAHDLSCTATGSIEIRTFGADLQVSADKMEICEGEMIVLNANLDGFNNENVSYEWEGEGLVATTGSTVSAIPTVEDYKYVVTATAGNCTMTDSLIITVHERPAAVLVTRTTDSIICTGAQVTFQAFPASAEMEYIWFQNGIQIPGNNLSTITVNMNEAGTYKYAVFAYDQYGCPSVILPDVFDSYTATGTYEYDSVVYHVVNPSTTAGRLALRTLLSLLRVEDLYYTNVDEDPIHVEGTGEVTIDLSVLPSDSVTVVAHPTVAITGDPMICHNQNINLYAVLNDTVNTMDYNYEWRLYNYSIVDGENEPGDGTPFFYVRDDNGNATFTTELQDELNNDPWLYIENLSAQDHPYIFSVVVTSQQGCRVESEPYYVYVGEDPVVEVTVDYTEVCAGAEITARAHLGNYNMDNLTAQWQVRSQDENGEYGRWDSIPYGLEGILHHNPTTTSQYRVIVTNAVTGCTATSDSVTVTVVKPVIVTRVVAVNAGDSSNNVCTGAQLNVVAYVLDDNGNEIIDTTLRYTWDLNGIQLNDIYGPTFSSQAGIYDNDPVDYVYTAFVTRDLPGCYPVAKKSDTVHVRRNPYVQIDGNPNVCYRGRFEPNVILLAWVDGIVDTNATYTWFESGHQEDNALREEINQYQASKAVTHDNPYIFQVEVTNGDGCTTMSEPFYVNVYAAPVVNITGDQNKVCTAGEVNLRANLNDYNDPLLTLQWFKNEVNNNPEYLIEGATDYYQKFFVDTTTNFIVEVTHMMNAFHDQEYCVGYDTFTVEVHKAPRIHAINDLAGVKNICEGRNITFAVDSVIGGFPGGDVYTWFVNGEEMLNANGSVFVHSPVAVNGVPTQYVYQVALNQSEHSACISDVYTLTDTITVYPQPVLYIQADPIVCTAQDSNIVLTVNMDPASIETNPNFTISYNWLEDNHIFLTDTAKTIYVTKPYRDYPYNFSVQTVNSYGCLSEASTVVYVNDTISIIPTISDTALCVGGEVLLSANLADWNADELRYQWMDNGVNIPEATTLEYPYAPTTVGSHTLVLNVEQMTSHCTASTKARIVMVNEDPVVDSISNNIPANNTVCDGYQVVLKANVSKGVAGGEVYTWYRNGDVIEGATQQILSEVVSAQNNEPTDYVYAVSVAQTASGCESNVETMTLFTVNPNPTVEIATDPIVCEQKDSNVVLIANVYPAVEGLTFRWFEDNTVIVGQTDDTLYMTKPYSENPYNFHVELVNSYNCTATDAASVYVNAKPIVHVFASQNSICKEGSVVLTASLANWNDEDLVYQWFEDGNEIVGATTLNYEHTPAALGEHVYTLTVDQTTSGCHAISDTAKVTVKAIPVISSVVIAPDTFVCYGSQLTITANVDAPFVAADGIYTWLRNGMVIEGAVGAVINDTPGIVDYNTQHYNYEVFVTYPDENGCVSDIQKSANVTVYANPRVQITGDQYVCETDSVFLIANVDTNGIAVGGLHYTWYMDGQLRDNNGYALGDSRFFAEDLYPRDEPYRFKVEVWRDNAVSACQAMSEEHHVYVFKQPSVAITASATDICTNGEVTLIANLGDWNADHITYQWYEVRDTVFTRATGFNQETGALTYEPVTEQYNYMIPGATSFWYTTTYDHTAKMGVLVTQTNSTCTAVDEILINVNAIPVVTSVTVSNKVVCDGAPITVTAHINPEDAEGAVYTWFRNGAEIEGVHGASFTENVFATNDHDNQIIYSAIVTLPKPGCTSIMSVKNDTVTVKRGPAEVYITGNNVICENDSTLLIAHSDINNGTFTWEDGTTGDRKYVKAGLYTVTMTTDEGCTMTSAPFEVTAIGSDVIVSATEQTICQGEYTTIFVDQEGWAGNVTYAWDTQVGETYRTSNSAVVNPDQTTTYHVTATVNSTNGTCSIDASITINVNQRPGKLTVTPDEPTTICEGEQVTFHATPANAAGYTWYQNGTPLSSDLNLSTITLTYNQAGTYYVAARAISDQGCESAEASDSVVVTVNAAPESVTISGNQVICQGGETTLYANVTPNVHATYKWYRDNELIAGATDSVYTTSVAGSYKVEATVNNCTTVSDPYEVTVQLAPQISLVATEDTICAGGSTVITATPVGWNNGDVVFTWSNGFTGPSFPLNNASAGVHKFIVTASLPNSGCTATDSIEIQVNNDPTAPHITVDKPTICDGGQVTLTVENADPNASYIWFRNNVMIDNATLSTYTENPTTVDNDEQQYVYTVKATLNMNGCESVMSNEATVDVISAPVPTMTVVGNTEYCEGGQAVLHVNVAPAANYQYQWYRDGIALAGETSNEIISADTARETAYKYHVEVSLYAGCDVTTEDVLITVHNQPTVDVMISDATVCVGGTATLTATPQGGVSNIYGLNPWTYEWRINNSSAVLGREATYTTSEMLPAGDYTYRVTVKSAYGCEVESDAVSFHVAADPQVQIVLVPGYDATVCSGENITAIKAVVDGGYGVATYQWYKNNTILDGQNSEVLYVNNLTYGTNDVYTVEVIQTGVECSNFATVNINDLVEINQPYTVNITGNGNVCEGGSLTLTANVENVVDGDVLTYMWYKVVNGEEALVATVQQDNTYTTSDLLLGNYYEYYVEVYGTYSGCVASSTTVPASVTAAPTVEIRGANTVCQGGELTLNAFVNDVLVEGADYTYTWNWYGAGNGSITTTDPTYVPTLTANDLATPYYFTVTISRQGNDNCTATSEAHMVNVADVPTVTITADNNVVCANGTVTFTAHVAPTGTYDYEWTINETRVQGNASTLTYTASNAGAINAHVEIHAVNSSASCGAEADLAMPVQVVNVPTVSINVDNNAMCVGGTVTLTANDASFNNIPGDLTYQWYRNGVIVEGAVARQLVQALDVASIYNYTLVVSTSANIGCTTQMSAPVTIQVAEQPVVSLSSLNGLAICEGGDITLTASVTNFGSNVNGVNNAAVYGNMTFDWNRNGINVHHNTGITSASNQEVETLNNVGNYSYQVVVTPAGYNCQPQTSNVEVVNVVSQPSWTEVHVYSSNMTSGCIGDMVTLTAAIQGGAFDYAGSTNGYIQWVVTDANQNTINVSGGLGGNSFDLPTVPGTYMYTPTFVGNIGSGCQLSNTAAVEQPITINELPTAVFSSGDGATICANDGSASAELVIDFTGAAPYYYQVVDNNGNVIAAASTMASSVSIYVAPTEQTTYRIVLVSDGNNCENTELTEAAMATVFVNNIEFTENFFESGCTDNGLVTVHFNMISGNPNAPFTVAYNDGITPDYNGTISNNTATFPAPVAAGDYNVVLTIDGCDYNVVVRVLAGDYAFGGSLPILDQRWNDVVVVNNNPAYNGGHVFVGFQWYRNGVAIPGATYSNYQEIGGLNGFYSVELIERDTVTGNMITYKTCEQYFNSTSNVKVYPVPANVRQEITIELDLTAEELEGAVLDIYSVTGAHINHVVDLQPITKIEGFKAQGTYFGRILTGTNEIKTVKFVIVK